jgi:hypothetical protein
MQGRKILLTATTLVAAILVATAAAGVVSAAGKHGAAPGKRLAGTWMSNVTLENPPPGVAASFQALNTFTRGGEVLVSSSQGLPAQRSLAQGDCERTGERSFECSFTWFRFDAAGNPIGTQRVRRSMTLGPDDDTFTSTDVIEIIAPNGAVVATLNGTEEAARLGV